MRLELWKRANLELIARSIAELVYEEILVLKEDEYGYFVELKSDVVYRFNGVKGAWDFLQIDPHSLFRCPGPPGLEASVFFRDANLDLGMSQITLTHFLEEMHNTLYSEMQVLQNRSEIKTPELILKTGEEIQAYLSGHPKILLNKGRIGFSARDLEKYAPEHKGKFQLMWIALKEGSFIEAASLQNEKYFNRTMAKNFKILEGHTLMPVHPWQFERYVKVQFQKEIADGTITPLTEAGPFYKPQISIRTLSNHTSAKESDIKLSLTILNTSAYRGISGENLQMGPELSAYMESICHQDTLLKERQTEVLKEEYALSFTHSAYSQIKDAPYRYNELLGCVVRESAASKLQPHETAVMTGALFYYGDDGKSLIGEYILRSKLDAKAWMQKYFRHVVIPLYHLQLSYGIGIVSHGQNIVLRMRNFIPSGVFIKDFQGDLRVSKDFIKTFPVSLQNLKTLPANYLIHDLITGHFVTVLRFISPIMEKCALLKESEFYDILRGEIESYLKTYHPSLTIDNPLHLLRPEFEKVILNKVRFEVGYEDSNARPLPQLGKNLKNPLVQNKDVL